MTFGTNIQKTYSRIELACFTFRIGLLLPRDALVHSAVLRLHVVRLSVCPSVCLSVCEVGGPGSDRLEILETNCTGT